MVEERPAQIDAPMPKGAEGVAIVGILLQQMESMKGDILSKIDENAKAALRRWQSHEDEHHNLEQGLKELKKRFDDHMATEREKQIVFNTRMSPFRSLYQFVVSDKRWLIVFVYIGIQFADDVWTFLHAVGLLQY